MVEVVRELTEEERLRHVWGGELPDNPYEMAKAREALRKWELDKKMTAKAKRRSNVDKRRSVKLREDADRAKKHLRQVKRFHRRAVNLNQERHEEMKQVTKSEDQKQRAAAARLQAAKVERVTVPWHPVRLRPPEPALEVILAIEPDYGSAASDNDAAIT